jgi:hypothetical protein
MTCGLIRLRCEQRYGAPAGEIPFWPPIDHRLFDVPPHLAAPIAAWLRLRGWDVLEEPI